MASPRSYETREFIYALVIFLVGLLPLSLIQALGWLAGLIVWYVVPGRRIMATQAVAHHLEKDGKEAARIARASFSNSFISFMEPMKGRDVDHYFVRDRFIIRDPERWQYLQDTDRPFMNTAAHIGAWEILAMFGPEAFPDKYKINVFRTTKDDDMNRAMVHLRTRSTTMYVGHREAASKVSKFLRQPRTVSGMVVDHNTLLKDAIFLPFLNDTAAVNVGPAMLAVRTKALVAPSFLIRQDGGRLMLCFEEILDTATLSGNIREKIKATALFYTQAVERIVRQFPEQWHWMHRRWKTRPEGE